MNIQISMELALEILEKLNTIDEVYCDDAIKVKKVKEDLKKEIVNGPKSPELPTLELNQPYILAAKYVNGKLLAATDNSYFNHCNVSIQGDNVDIAINLKGFK